MARPTDLKTALSKPSNDEYSGEVDAEKKRTKATEKARTPKDPHRRFVPFDIIVFNSLLLMCDSDQILDGQQLLRLGGMNAVIY